MATAATLKEFKVNPISQRIITLNVGIKTTIWLKIAIRLIQISSYLLALVGKMGKMKAVKIDIEKNGKSEMLISDIIEHIEITINPENPQSEIQNPQ